MLSTPSNIERIRAISATLKDLDLAYRIFDELPDGILLVDRSGIIRLVNKQSEALFGYTRFELDGSPLSLLIPETLKGLHAEHFHAYLANPVKRPMMPTEKHGLKLVGVPQGRLRNITRHQPHPHPIPRSIFRARSDQKLSGRNKDDRGT
jgi:PAS domain-containing protein